MYKISGQFENSEFFVESFAKFMILESPGLWSVWEGIKHGAWREASTRSKRSLVGYVLIMVLVAKSDRW